MVGFGGPGVDLNGISQCNDKELDSFILYNLEMNSTLEYDYEVMKLDFPTKGQQFSKATKITLCRS